MKHIIMNYLWNQAVPLIGTIVIVKQSVIIITSPREPRNIEVKHIISAV